jgi:hypothetical protein
MITPAIDALKKGSTEILTADVVAGDGSQRAVAASWSSDVPAVVSIDESGRVRGASLGTTMIRASFLALSTLQPMRVVPDYEGQWTGDYRILNCTQSSGAGPSYCRFAIQSALPFRIVLTQKRASLSGTFEFFTNIHTVAEVGPIDGSIDESGQLVLTGTTSTVEAGEESATTLADWNTSLTGDGDQMTGHFVKFPHFRNFFGWQDSREDCEIVRSSRSQP